ncbi:MAG: hypothetical protein ACRDRP_16190 [Pseudonocardiaceae bacterium]
MTGDRGVGQSELAVHLAAMTIREALSPTGINVSRTEAAAAMDLLERWARAGITVMAEVNVALSGSGES